VLNTWISKRPKIPFASLRVVIFLSLPPSMLGFCQRLTQQALKLNPAKL